MNINGIPVIVSPFVAADTMHIVHKGTPDQFILVDNIATIERAVRVMNAPWWQKLLWRIKAWLNIPFNPRWRWEA